MKKLFVLVLVAAACSPAKKEENQAQSETSVAASLTEAQKIEGWKLIFDGKTLSGWKIFKDRKNNTWEVQEGMLHCKALNEQTGDGDMRADLMTVEEFENLRNPRNCQVVVMQKNANNRYELLTELAKRDGR